MYKSNRDIELVTQSLYLLEESEYEGILTVEKYNKWYKLFILDKEGNVTPIYNNEKDYINDLWGDHVVYPDKFHELAKSMNLVYDDETFAMVCYMFVAYGIEDWGKLKYYLPEEDDII